MAHLVDGVLSTPVIIAGAAIAVAGISIGLRRIDGDRLPYCGLMSAGFYVASLVHVPVGPSNVHLILNGLLGVVLGWAAFPAIFVALLLQALFFGHGGITVLGVNTVIMGLPAVACFYLFAPLVRRQGRHAWACGALAGALAILLTCVGVATALALSGREYVLVAKLIIIAHLPVMIVEAVVTGTIVVFLQRVKPEVLALPMRLPEGQPSRA